MTEITQRDAYVRWLESRLGAGRMAHSFGVENTARSLAQRYGEDIEKAALAGLFHDCAKQMEDRDLLAQAQAGGFPLDEVYRATPQLLHGPVAAILVRQDLGIDDEAVLSAIRWHTIPRDNMSTLDKIISVADLVEPTRDYPGVTMLRQAVSQDLDEAFLMGLARVMVHVLERGRLLHPDTVRVYNNIKLAQAAMKRKEL